MGIREPVPPWVHASLSARAIAPEQVEYALATDLRADGSAAEEWVVVAQDRVLVLAGAATPRELRIQDIDELVVENLVSGGLLTAKVAGEHELLCRFSGVKARSFGQLARVVNKLKKGETLEPADLEDEETPVCPRCGRRYPDKDRKVCPKCTDRRSLFLRVLSYLPRYRGEVTAVLGCMAAAAALRLAGPYLGGRVFFDQVLTPGGALHGRILAVLLLMGAFQISSALVDMIYGRISARVAACVTYDIKTEIFAALQRLSLGFFAKKQTGGLMTRVNRDAMHLQYFLLDGVPYLVVNSLLAAGVITVMALMDWRLTILVVVPTPLIVIVAKHIFPRMWTLFSRQFRRRSILNALMNDTFTGVRVVKSFGKEEEEVRRFHPANLELYGATLSANQMWASVFPVMQFVMQLGGLAVWAVGGLQVAAAGRVSFGTLMSFVSYIVMLYNPLRFFSNVIEWWAHCMNAAGRIFEIVDSEPEVTDAPDAIRIARLSGDIALQNVTFSYEPNRPVLHDISLSIKAGEMVGLVGHTGAGKSTLINLVTRLYDAQEGSIEIDGVPVRRIALEDLRAGMGIVLQEVYLFSGSVAENIAYARPEAGREEIIRAARAANAHEFIVALPDGYDTLLGRRGVELSGGERQRLSIARVLLRNPRILIFDEATSSVDTETERKIQEAIERLVEGRTTIAIAHRLSTLRRADRLVILEHGKIAEQGTHAELMQREGVYHKLVHRERQALKIIAVGDT